LSPAETKSLIPPLASEKATVSNNDRLVHALTPYLLFLLY